jgi:hypothetical protein
MKPKNDFNQLLVRVELPQFSADEMALAEQHCELLNKLFKKMGSTCEFRVFLNGCNGLPTFMQRFGWATARPAEGNGVWIDLEYLTK